MISENGCVKYLIIPSVVYNLLTKLCKLESFRLTSRIWKMSWDLSCRIFKCSVKTEIHNYPVLVNYGYLYPLIARKVPNYNNPIVELTYQVFKNKGSKIDLVDIGAGIGDTILLLSRNCPNMINEFICIEGEDGFYNYLQNNLKEWKNGRSIKTLLSSKLDFESQLIRLHSGTASAQGAKVVQSETLDSLYSEGTIKGADLIKIDVDGFDGKVLLGARNYISKYKPAVIFEWHPIVCEQTGSNYIDHFESLSNYGYTKYIFYTKYGNFNHVMSGLDIDSINSLAKICLESKEYDDWHYDVIALTEENPISMVALADMTYSKNKISDY